MKVTEADLAKLLASEVIKRDALEGPRAEDAAKVIRKYARRRAKAEHVAQASTTPPNQLPA